MTSLAAPPNTLQDSLIHALSGDLPERALEQAFLQLSRGGSLPLVLAMIRALVNAGMAGLALRMLHATAGLLAAEPQLAALASRLDGLPAGELGHAELRRRFEMNCSALEIQGKLSPDFDGSFDISDFGVFQSAKGNVHVVRGKRGCGLHFVFPFADQVAQVNALNIPSEAPAASYLLIGVPSVPLWRRLLTVRTSAGYRPPIYICETDMRVMQLWLHLIEAPEAWRDDRVWLFSGDDALAALKQHILSDAARTPPSICLTNRRSGWQPPTIDDRFHSAIATAVRDREHASAMRLSQQYPAMDTDAWRSRFRNARNAGLPLRIVGFTNRYSAVIQHVMRDLCSAFERRGCDFEIVTQAHDSSAIVDVAAALERKQRDMIVVLDHLRFEYGSLMPTNIPYVGWIQDYMEPLWDKRAGQSVGELDLVVGHSPQVMSSLYDYPLNRFLPSSNLTDPHTYSCEPVEESETADLRCDVSYVSHGSATPQQLVEELSAGSGPQFGAMMARALEIIQERMQRGGALTNVELLRVMLQAEHESRHPPLSPDVRRSRLLPVIARLYDRVFRHQALEWVGRWARTRRRAFKLYGKGWERHPSLAEFASGEVASGRPLRCLYQASTISLQINAYASLHQRLLDGIASGGFVLTRWNPADFHRGAFAALQRHIREHGLRSLHDVIKLRKQHESFESACLNVERLTGMVIQTLDDPNRAEHARIVQCTNGMSELRTDEGLFDVLAQAKVAPARAAADLPRFGECTFERMEQLESSLDRFIKEDKARHEIAARMRDAVLRHDTYDSLVEKIIDHFAGLPESRT